MFIQVRSSQVDGGGEGLYARRNLVKGEIVAFYNGVLFDFIVNPGTTNLLNVAFQTRLQWLLILLLSLFALFGHSLTKNPDFILPDPTTAGASRRSSRELGDFGLQDLCQHRRGGWILQTNNLRSWNTWRCGASEWTSLQVIWRRLPTVQLWATKSTTASSTTAQSGEISITLASW